MVVFDVVSLPIILVLDHRNVSFELLVQASKSWVLKVDQVVNVDQVIPQSHLVLLFSFVEITIKHLQNGIFRVNLTVVILLENLDLFL